MEQKLTAMQFVKLIYPMARSYDNPDVIGGSRFCILPTGEYGHASIGEGSTAAGAWRHAEKQIQEDQLRTGSDGIQQTELNLEAPQPEVSTELPASRGMAGRVALETKKAIGTPNPAGYIKNKDSIPFRKKRTKAEARKADRAHRKAGRKNRK